MKREKEVILVLKLIIEKDITKNKQMYNMEASDNELWKSILNRTESVTMTLR